MNLLTVPMIAKHTNIKVSDKQIKVSRRRAGKSSRPTATTTQSG
jgi:hypothetical protein